MKDCHWLENEPGPLLHQFYIQIKVIPHYTISSQKNVSDLCNDEQPIIHLREFMILLTKSIDSSNSTSSTDITNKDTVCFT
jgi:hypothetical protein